MDVKWPPRLIFNTDGHWMINYQDRWNSEDITRMMPDLVAAGVDALIRKLQQTFSLTSVVVTHELASVELIADRACLLKDGQVIGFGTVDELRANPHPFAQQFFARKPDDEEDVREEFIRSLTET